MVSFASSLVCDGREISDCGVVCGICRIHCCESVSIIGISGAGRELIILSCDSVEGVNVLLFICAVSEVSDNFSNSFWPLLSN